MPHGSLGGSRCNPALVQQGAESGPQGMNVESAAPFVSFRDPSPLQITIENPQQTRWNVEQRHVRRKAGRDRRARGQRFFLEFAQLLDKPVAQVLGQVVPERNLSAATVLLVSCIQ